MVYQPILGSLGPGFVGTTRHGDGGVRLEMGHHAAVDAEASRYTTTTELLNPKRRFVHDRATCETRDIAGAQPRKRISTLGPRSLDPLDPTYVLPSYDVRPATPPKFVKDSLDTRDIWGAQPAIPRQQLIKTRDHIDYSDVQGSKSRPLVRSRARHAQQDTLDVFDINRGDYKTFRSRRLTDPLSPRYDFDAGHCTSLTKEYSKVMSNMRNEKARRRSTGEDDAHWIGDIPGSHSCGPARPREKDMQLVTADIMGGHHPPGAERRDPPRHPCDISDISGAQASTVKYKPKTRRHTNPLQPAYRFLDYGRRKTSSSSQQTGRRVPASQLERKGSRSVPSTPFSKGTFSFEDAPSAELTPAEPRFAGTALHHGKRVYGAGRRNGTKAAQRALGTRGATSKAPGDRSNKLPPMNSHADKWTSRSSPPFDRRAAALPSFHRQNSKTFSRKHAQRATTGSTSHTGGSTTTEYQQRRREQRRNEDMESVRGLN